MTTDIYSYKPTQLSLSAVYDEFTISSNKADLPCKEFVRFAEEAFLSLSESEKAQQEYLKILGLIDTDRVTVENAVDKSIDASEHFEKQRLGILNQLSSRIGPRSEDSDELLLKFTNVTENKVYQRREIEYRLSRLFPAMGKSAIRSTVRSLRGEWIRSEQKGS